MLKVIIVILTVGVLLGFSLAFAEEANNIARNGSFEEDLVEWTLAQNIRGSVASAEIDDKDAVDGKKSAYIKIDTAGADFHTVRIEQSGLKVEQDQKYTLSVWLKAEGERTARLYAFDLAGGAPWVTFLNEEVTISTEWEEYSGTFDAERSSDNVSISVRIGELDPNVWVDNVKLYEGEYVPTEVEEEAAVSAGDKLSTTWGSIKTQY